LHDAGTTTADADTADVDLVVGTDHIAKHVVAQETAVAPAARPTVRTKSRRSIFCPLSPKSSLSPMTLPLLQIKMDKPVCHCLKRAP
jgi:hypothetical protein